jgi:hypothetical protein
MQDEPSYTLTSRTPSQGDTAQKAGKNQERDVHAQHGRRQIGELLGDGGESDRAGRGPRGTMEDKAIEMMCRLFSADEMRRVAKRWLPFMAAMHLPEPPASAFMVAETVVKLTREHACEATAIVECIGERPRVVEMVRDAWLWGVK